MNSAAAFRSESNYLALKWETEYRCCCLQLKPITSSSSERSGVAAFGRELQRTAEQLAQ